ncbi:MAG TPA: SBBP repeat-containing protein, partial [Pyrinomonadaceae bacterium]|nr:SBBP repeat-containing protein [Pyrinomonadaceae bacterium]
MTKINATGSALVYSTFLGGEFHDVGQAIAVDASGNAFIGGFTQSPNFPTVNAFQTFNPGFELDGFVTKINAAGSALVYSTYLGGDGSDGCFGIAVDAFGSAYVTGITDSLNFPTLGALQPEKGVSSDAFVTKLAPTGSSLIHSTYLGGSSSEIGSGLALDSLGNIYVVGTTLSTDFPTVNPLQAGYGGVQDVFVAKLRPAGDLNVTITDTPDPVNFGSNLTYTINVKNDGEVAATGVTLTDTLPAGAALVSVTPSTGLCTGTTSINCGLGTLAAGAIATVTVIVTPPAVRTITNTATVTLNETDAFLGNNTATAATLVDFADLSITERSSHAFVTPGGILTYSLIVKNKSGIPAPATIIDNLPGNTSLIHCAATGNGVCGGSGNNVSVVFPQIAVGASEAVLLTVAVSGSMTVGSVIFNSPTVSSTVPDPDTSNNSGISEIGVVAVTVFQKSNGLIAFASNRNPAPSGIFTVKPDLTDEQLFPNSTFNAFRPVWSPDGTKLAFQSVNHSGNSPATEINVVNA